MIQHELSKKLSQQMVLASHPYRQIFGIGKRILTNRKSNQVDTQTHYENDVYLKAKKKFREETAHLMPGSDEYIKIRNRTYKELNQKQAKIENRIAYKDKDHMQKDIQHDGDFLNQLIVIPESLDCHEMIHVLNFNRFPFIVREDNYFQQKLKLRIGFKKEDNYPVLYMDSSSKLWPTHCVNDYQEIMNYLTSKNLLMDHRNHSAQENQGLQFIDDKLVPLFKQLYCTFQMKILFYMQGGRNFRQQQLNTLKTSLAWTYAWKMFKAIYLSFIEKREVRQMLRDKYDQEEHQRKQEQEGHELDAKLNKTERPEKETSMVPEAVRSVQAKSFSTIFYQQGFSQLHTYCDEWVERCQIDADNEKYFHGGSWPDRADFRMFALFFQHYHTRPIQQFLKVRGGHTEDPFCKWFERMRVVSDYRQNIEEKQFGFQ